MSQTRDRDLLWPADNKACMNQNEIRSITKKGILAPSADNLQPWKFRLGENQVDLFLDPEHAKNFCDEGYAVSHLSAGAVIENMRVASAQMGYWLSPSYFPEKGNPAWVATMRFTPMEQQGHPHFPVLEARTTNRKFYHVRRKIDMSTYSKLEQMVESEKGFKLKWLKKGSSSYSKLCRLIGKADQIRFENERLHRELFETLRYNQEEVQKTKDGLDLKTFETGYGGAVLFKLIASWKRLKILNFFGMSRLLNFYSQLQLWSSQAAGLITAASQAPLDYVLGGEIMEKVWHEITRSGLALQPMEALPIFIINFNLTGGAGFTENQKKKLQELKREFYPLFGLKDHNALILLFRIGYAAPPTACSLRRPLESFLTP